MDKEKFKIKAQKLLNQFNVGNYQFVLRESNILLKKIPNNSFLMNLVGSCFQKIGDLEKAKLIFRDIIALDKNNIAAFNNLGNTYKNLKDYSNAEINYRNALKLNENYPNTLQNLANLKFELNENEEAIILYKKSIKSDPNNHLTYYNLGLVYQALGKFDDAKECLEKVIKISPDFTNADKIISRFTKYKRGDEHIIDMENRLKNIKLSEFNKANILFSLGKAYEDTKDFEKSFDSLEKANQKMKVLTKYDFTNDKLIFEALHEIFNKFDRENLNKQFNKKKIIFIVGLPRSGTSLLEQILSTHSNVYGAGELPYLSDAIKKVFFKNNKFLPEIFKNINKKENLEEIKNDFFRNIENFNFDENFISDKNPLNFLWIGFIKLIFPDAKIIHIKRNLQDNFFSLYKNSFDGNMNWCYNKSDLLNYCLNYKKLMDFWNSKNPGHIFNINYEDLISNTKLEIQNILSFCELPWEENCLEYHKSKRAIKTVSSAQARKPIYKSSINSFQNYSKFLGDFFTELENS